jgi:hypothetical protein
MAGLITTGLAAYGAYKGAQWGANKIGQGLDKVGNWMYKKLADRYGGQPKKVGFDRGRPNLGGPNSAVYHNAAQIHRERSKMSYRDYKRALGGVEESK